MGEESTIPVYIGKYDYGKVVFEPLVEFEVTNMNIEDTYPDDVVAPMRHIQNIMGESITVRAFFQKKGLRGFYKAIGMPGYLRTEYLFPKKKKRGTARRKRKIERAKKRFIKFVHDKYGDDLIGTRATQVFIDELPAFAGPFEGEE